MFLTINNGCPGLAELDQGDTVASQFGLEEYTKSTATYHLTKTIRNLVSGLIL